jgi:hypothetical protein
MKKCAIIIGVNNVAGMIPLRAAVTGAKDIDAWAREQNYETKLLTDDNNEKVTKSKIKAAVKEFLDEDCYELMVIFFAGHGIGLSPNHEYWLLNDAAVDSDEVVNVQLNSNYAESCPIPHVVFISDCCRNPPQDPAIMQVSGGIIFPSNMSGDDNFVDKFFATRFGKTALEASTKDGAVESFGVYTRCLLEGLSGLEESILTTISEGQTKINVILASQLGDYLGAAVPKKLESIDRRYWQKPFASVTSKPPKYLAKISRGTRGASDYTYPLIDKGWMPDYIEGEDDLEYKSIRALTPPSVIYTGDAVRYMDRRLLNTKDVYFWDIFDEYNKIQSLISEARAYFIIDGLSDPMLLNMDSQDDVMIIKKDHYNLIAVMPGHRRNFILLQLPNGDGVPLSLISGFVGIALFIEGRMVNIKYEPALKHPRFFYSEHAMMQRALIATAAEYGMLYLSGSVEQVLKDAGNHDNNDPNLLLYMLYAYTSQNQSQNVRALYNFYHLSEKAPMYDTNLFKYISSKQKSPGEFREMLGYGPLLTQGWAYLPAVNDMLSERTRLLSRHLVPGLWTRFTSEGVRILLNNYN